MNANGTQILKALFSQGQLDRYGACIVVCALLPFGKKVLTIKPKYGYKLNKQSGGGVALKLGLKGMTTHFQY